MSELTLNTGIQIYVEAPTFQFGERGPEDVVEFAFDYKANGNTIEYIQRGCGCSSAYWDEDNNQIKGTLELSKAGNFQPGETPVSKDFLVYLNDGQKRYIADEAKQMVTNPNKTWFRLMIAGTVVIESKE